MVVGGTCRLLVRAACHRAGEDRLSQVRRLLRRGVAWEALAAAVASYYLGRWMALVWGGIFAASWGADYGIRLELERRRQRANQAEVDRRRQAHEAARERVRQEAVDNEAADMVAAYKREHGDL
jgi:hypothetical protein